MSGPVQHKHESKFIGIQLSGTHSLQWCPWNLRETKRRSLGLDAAALISMPPSINKAATRSWSKRSLSTMALSFGKWKRKGGAISERDTTRRELSLFFTWSRLYSSNIALGNSTPQEAAKREKVWHFFISAFMAFIVCRTQQRTGVYSLLHICASVTIMRWWSESNANR